VKKIANKRSRFECEECNVGLCINDCFQVSYKNKLLMYCYLLKLFRKNKTVLKWLSVSKFMKSVFIRGNFIYNLHHLFILFITIHFNVNSGVFWIGTTCSFSFSQNRLEWESIIPKEVGRGLTEFLFSFFYFYRGVRVK